MKKLGKKLQLNRETLHKLDPRELAEVNGAVVWTGCMSECTECGGGGSIRLPMTDIGGSQ
jgi:hypothetical protein